MISIGLPVYNGEKFLNRKLDTLLSQTYSDFEIIISDNGSTDLTSKICNDYLKKDKRIKYFRQKENLGVIANYNFVARDLLAEQVQLAMARSKLELLTAQQALIISTIMHN